MFHCNDQKQTIFSVCKPNMTNNPSPEKNFPRGYVTQPRWHIRHLIGVLIFLTFKNVSNMLLCY